MAGRTSPRTSMLRRIEQTIRERKLIRSGMRVIAAVSGGADSVAMLHALVELKDALGITLFVFHLDHGLRGRASNADALFVERLCKQLKVRGVVTKRLLIREKARPGNSIEMTARSARLEEMRSALSKLKADVVAVAHHADDQAETVLMRLLSGSGLEGLAGMDYESEPLPGLHVVRPMLDVSRKDIRSYLRRKKASWREDASNRSVRFRRNRIRHEMLPYLRKQGFAGVDSVLVRLSEIMRAENELIEQRTGALVTRVKIRSTDRLSLERLGRCHVADQRRILRAWIAGAGLPMRDVDLIGSKIFAGRSDAFRGVRAS